MHPRFEEEIALLLKKAKRGSISLQEILEILSGKGKPLAITLLSLPFCQPVQIPGFSTPFGILIACIGFRMLFGYRIWLPKWLKTKKISLKNLEKLFHFLLKITHGWKRWIHPRLSFLCTHPFMHIMHGIVITLLGLFLALPLPIPCSNLVVAWPLLCMGIGLMEEDGLFVIIGYSLVALATLFFSFLITLTT